MFNIELKSNKGVSLYLTIVIMSILLAISFGVGTIFLGQTKIIRGMGDSVIALYAADTGIERALYNIRKESGTGNVSETWGVNYGYIVNESSCDGKTCISSVGTYKETKRAIEAKY